MYPHLLSASLTLLSGHIPSISGPSENLPTYVFQVRFPPRKHGVRGNECQKRSIVSVWYAQNSLPFCTEVWYTTLTGCEDPTKMLIRVCILLQMQPAPLTGTATSTGRRSPACLVRCSPHPSRGQQLGPPVHCVEGHAMQPVPLTGTATVPDAAALPLVPDGCSPCPSRGQQPRLVLPYPCLRSDAARTPHGDNNGVDDGKRLNLLVMQPVPLTGTATFSMNFSPCVAVMQPVPLTGTATSCESGLCLRF